MIVSEIGTKTDSAKVQKRSHVIERTIERMVGEVPTKQEKEIQLTIIRGLVYVGIPVLAIVGCVEFIHSKGVDPLVTIFGTAIMTALTTLLKVNGSSDKPKS